MFLHALATASPDVSFTQQECWELVKKAESDLTHLDRRSRLLLRSILRGDSGIETRQFAVRDPSRLFSHGPDELHEEFRRSAPALACAALRKALIEAECGPEEIDALIVCTCTGYLCPGVSSYVSEQMGIRPDAWLQDLVGLGCGAAIPSLRAAEAILAANPDAVVACVAVEICSAAFYLDNDRGVLVSACLFGDGAAASIWRSTPARRVLRVGSFQTVHQPESREHIRFEMRNGKLRNKLDSCVPGLAAKAVEKLHREATQSKPIGKILAHSGGKDVIAAIEMALPGSSLDETRDVLRRHGNMSSPSVLFALQQALQHGEPEPDKDWWMVSFGAGFSAHSCRVTGS